MYPALEITLRLDRIRAAQRPVPAAVGAAFRTLHVRHQPAPFDAARQDLRASRRPPKRRRPCAPQLPDATGGRTAEYAAESITLGAGRLSSSGSPAGDPAVDVLGEPDAALGELGYRLRKVRAAGELMPRCRLTPPRRTPDLLGADQPTTPPTHPTTIGIRQGRRVSQRLVERPVQRGKPCRLVVDHLDPLPDRHVIMRCQKGSGWSSRDGRCSYLLSRNGSLRTTTTRSVVSTSSELVAGDGNWALPHQRSRTHPAHRGFARLRVAPAAPVHPDPTLLAVKITADKVTTWRTRCPPSTTVD